MELLDFGFFMDGFSLLKVIAAFLSCLVLANLPVMMQMPDFHFLNFLIRAGENSSSSWFRIRNVEKEVEELEGSGLWMKFSGYDEGMKLPKSEKTVNGEHFFV